jgi:hypothetical protein
MGFTHRHETEQVESDEYRMHDKHWGNKLGVPEFIQAVVGFFDNGSRVRRALAGRFIELLQPLRDMMADQSLYRFYAR